MYLGIVGQMYQFVPTSKYFFTYRQLSKLYPIKTLFYFVTVFFNFYFFCFLFFRVAAGISLLSIFISIKGYQLQQGFFDQEKMMHKNFYLEFPVTCIARIKFSFKLKQSFPAAFLETCKVIILLFVDRWNSSCVCVTILRETNT